MSFAKWCAISSAVLITGAAASWWIPTSGADRSSPKAESAAKASRVRAAIDPVTAAQTPATLQVSSQDDDVVRKAGLAMLQQALQAGAPNDGTPEVNSQGSIGWPTPAANLERPEGTPVMPRLAASGDDHLTTAADDTEPPAVRSFEPPSAVHRIKHIGHKEAATPKPHKTAQEEAATPKSHKAAQAEYIERVVEQGDAGAVTYKDVRRRCEPGSMVDVCYMPAKNRRSIVIERY
jgi:hypothetical protein